MEPMKDYRYIVEQFKPDPNGAVFLQHLRFCQGPGVKHMLWIMHPEGGGSPIHRVRVVDDYEPVKAQVSHD